ASIFCASSVVTAERKPDGFSIRQGHDLSLAERLPDVIAQRHAGDEGDEMILALDRYAGCHAVTGIPRAVSAQQYQPWRPDLSGASVLAAVAVSEKGVAVRVEKVRGAQHPQFRRARSEHRHA